MTPAEVRPPVPQIGRVGGAPLQPHGPVMGRGGGFGVAVPHGVVPPPQILAWEERQLDQPVDFGSAQIDPAPFQLVERTSLHKVCLHPPLGVHPSPPRCPPQTLTPPRLPADPHHLLAAGPQPRLRHQHRAPGGHGVPQGGEEPQGGCIGGVGGLSTHPLMESGCPQLRKAIEGSLTAKGVKVVPPLASFRRRSSTSAPEPDTTDLCQLWDRHQHHPMPREAGPDDGDTDK